MFRKKARFYVQQLHLGPPKEFLPHRCCFAAVLPACITCSYGFVKFLFCFVLFFFFFKFCFWDFLKRALAYAPLLNFFIFLPFFFYIFFWGGKDEFFILVYSLDNFLMFHFFFWVLITIIYLNSRTTIAIGLIMWNKKIETKNSVNYGINVIDDACKWISVFFSCILQTFYTCCLSVIFYFL